MIRRSGMRRSLGRACRAFAMVILASSLLTAGCLAMKQTRYEVEAEAFSLGPDDLERWGIGFLTPAAATGREADKQALAYIFAKELGLARPGVKVVPLPVILSAVNAADLDQQYKRMYRDYLETGILEGTVLERVGAQGGVRFLAQLSLADFQQQSRGRFSLLGLRMVDTKLSSMRVFVQIWDSEAGAVAWEGSIELNFAYDTAAERPSPFMEAAEIAARRLYQELPGATR
ncbi:MAG: hypothetical protein QY320_12665 [Gammaproteobacteria bacterium]|nr:MAG: hypothetical protein QY320_12665 [Gammaproteobacteria bacterium]